MFIFKLIHNLQIAKLNWPNFAFEKPIHDFHNLHSIDNSSFDMEATWCPLWRRSAPDTFSLVSRYLFVNLAFAQ